MKTSLSDEQRQALSQEPEGIVVEDAQTQKVYFLADAQLHQRAMEALRQKEDRAAIQAGIDAAEQGRVSTFEEVDARIREKFGLDQR